MRDSALMRSIQAVVVAVSAALAVVGAAHAQIFAGEKEILRQARYEWLSMKRHTPLAPSPRIQNYVECVAYKVINVLDESFADLSWEVVVFDDDALNAFAMPGGKIGVFTGILNVADTPDALAAVLGHEVAHLTEDHVMDRVRRERRNEALVLGAGALTGLPGTARDMGTIFLSLPFGREQESQADLVGLDYMARAGFDPRASLYLWRNMSASKQTYTPEFLSTHPADDRRMDDLVKNLTPALIKYNEARDAGIRPNCHM